MQVLRKQTLSSNMINTTLLYKGIFSQKKEYFYDFIKIIYIIYIKRDRSSTYTSVKTHSTVY